MRRFKIIKIENKKDSEAQSISTHNYEIGDVFEFTPAIKQWYTFKEGKIKCIRHEKGSATLVNGDLNLYMKELL
jgi:hypothetical protein